MKTILDYLNEAALELGNPEWDESKYPKTIAEVTLAVEKITVDFNAEIERLNAIVRAFENDLD